MIFAANSSRVGRNAGIGNILYSSPSYSSTCFSSWITSTVYQGAMSDPTIKGLPPPPQSYDGSAFRIAIVHARWNEVVIKSLVEGTVRKLKERGVKAENIVVKSVPGSYELPFACQKSVSSNFIVAVGRAHQLARIHARTKLTRPPLHRLIAGGQTQSSNTASYMLSSSANLLSLIDSSAPPERATPQSTSKPSASTSAFSAVIAIGVLIKGSTMHFEYISDAVSHGLMRVQLDTGVPVVFGVLTTLTDDQALERAGMGKGEKKGHSEFPQGSSAAL